MMKPNRQAMARKSHVPNRQCKNFKAKGGTLTTKTHRFEPFSKRIAKITINPVRRTAPSTYESSDLSPKSSSFGCSLLEWAEINLSQNFVDFVLATRDSCETLPQVVHHADLIMDNLEKHIKKDDALSLEPLLNLLTHLARDLGPRFECYFGRAVTIICDIASANKDVSVVEWCFNSLAWLFKYLSRLLVTDLRRLYDLMAPLLGKTRQKHFIMRFAAEAFSFLIRKASTMYHKSQEPLNLILSHIVDDIASLSDMERDRYTESIISLIFESIRGVKREIHTTGVTTFTVFLQHLVSSLTESYKNAQPCYLLSGLLHKFTCNLDSAGLEHIMEPFLQTILRLSIYGSTSEIALAIMLLKTVTDRKHESLTMNWAETFKILDKLLGNVSTELRDNNIMDDLQDTVAIIFCRSSSEQAKSNVSILYSMTSGPWETRFLRLCWDISEMNGERVEQLLFPILQSFIDMHPFEYAPNTSYLVSHLFELGHNTREALNCPRTWQNEIQSFFKKISADNEDGNKRNNLERFAYIQMLETMHFHRETSLVIANSLMRLMDSASETIKSGQRNFSVEVAFTGALKYLSQRNCCNNSIWPSICASSQFLRSMPFFWEAILCFLKSCKDTIEYEKESFNLIICSLTQSLSNSSHELRLICLSVFHMLYKRTNQEVPELLNSMVKVEETPPTLENMRLISMEMRKISAVYKCTPIDSWLHLAVPSFCFGLLHVKLSKLWDDVQLVIEKVLDANTCDTFLIDKFISWLQIKDLEAAFGNMDENGWEYNSDGDFFDLQKLFSDRTTEYPDVVTSCRSQALRLLDGFPHFAERKSCQIVPIFLEAANRIVTEANGMNIAEDIVRKTHDGRLYQKWNRKDCKLFLSIFAKFKNPRTMYRSHEVYDTLIHLVGNGDLEYQQLAFKAIQTWRLSSVNKYSNQLNDLLNETKHNDELLHFLGNELQDNSLDDIEKAELIPVLLHILYGRAIAKNASIVGSSESFARRRNIIVAVSNLGHKELEIFLDIALCQRKVEIASGYDTNSENKLSSSKLRSIHGTLRMIEDILVALGSKVTALAPRIMDALISCIKSLPKHSKDYNTSGDNDDVKINSLLKVLRRHIINCIILMNERCTEFSWESYLPIIVSRLVEPRLDDLPIENAHSVSSVLKLLGSCFTSSNQAIYLLDRYPTLLRKLVDCIIVPTAKDDVIEFIIRDILTQVFELALGVQLYAGAVDESAIKQRDISDILDREARYIIINLNHYLRKHLDKKSTYMVVQALALISRLVRKTEDAVEIFSISTYLLLREPKKLDGSTVDSLLQLISFILVDHHQELNSNHFDRILEALCIHFTFQKSQTTRRLLCSTMETLGSSRVSVDGCNHFDLAVKLSLQLNAAFPKNLNIPNEDQQINALSSIVQLTNEEFEALSWKLPFSSILYNLRYSDDFVLRSHCNAAIRQLIDVATKENETGSTLRAYIRGTLVPYLFQGVRNDSEAKRADVLALCAYLIRRCPEIHPITELGLLNFHNEEEASFFNNVLHVQLHRRIRALKRLSKEISAGKISTRNIKNFLLPLIQHFVLSPKEGSNEQNLASEAITTIESLLDWLKWEECLVVFDCYFGYLRSPNYNPKLTVRLVGAVANSLWEASIIKQYGVDCILRRPGKGLGKPYGLEAMQPTQLTLTSPNMDGLVQDLTIRRIPMMMKFLRDKEVNESGYRASIAISVIKLIMALPAQEVVVLLPSVLSDLAGMLKSREQDSRDLARKALTEGMYVLGPDYFGSVLKELQSALQEGYQLHILGFTLHSLLLAAVDHFSVGTLDYCIPQIMQSVYDDVFGQTGKEKDREGYTNKMKEVKGKKSYDSIELIAKLTKPQKLMEILGPLRELLLKRIDSSSFAKVEEVLRRLCSGIALNRHYHVQDTLVLCYEIFTNSRLSCHKSLPEKANTISKSNSAVPLSKNHLWLGTNSLHVQKMRRFALDVTRLVIQRSPELQNTASISGLLPIINEAVTEEQEEIKISGIRLLSAIVKIPSAKLDSDAATYVSEAVKIIEDSPATNVEIAQASIKLVAAILRERQSVILKDQDIINIIKKIQPDLQEPDRQGVTFNFLKSVLQKKILAPEVYEAIDEVAIIMVTNHSTNAREQARALYIRFFMEYPQSQIRLEKQVAFLLKNLGYEHADGRVSVMEALNLVLKKIGDKVLQPILETCFIPILLVVCNDQASECKEMAGELIKIIFKKADSRRIDSFLLLLIGWLEQTEKLELKRISLRCFSMFCDAGKSLDSLQSKRLYSDLLDILTSNSNMDTQEHNWEMPYLALELLFKLSLFADNKCDLLSNGDLWPAINSKLNFPHAWVKLTAAKLVGVFLTRIKNCETNTANTSHRKESQGKPKLEMKDIIHVMLRSFDVLDSMVVNEQLAAQTTQNLVHIGCYFATNDLGVESKNLLMEDPATPSHITNSAEALAHIFMKAAGILPRHPSMILSDRWRSQEAVLRMLSALIRILTPEAIAPSLEVLTTPLYLLVTSESLTSLNIDQNMQGACKVIVEGSNDIIDTLRENFNTAFLEALQKIRGKTFEKREERRAKRKIEAVNMPEKDLAKKRKKHEMARRRRKEKSLQARSKRRGW